MSEDQNLSYWTSQLSSATKCVKLSIDPGGPSAKSQTAKTHSITLPPALSNRVHELASEEKIETHRVLLAVFVVLLGRYTRRDDLAISFANETARSMGKERFEDVAILRCQLSGEPTFREFLHRVSDSLAASKAHPVPFEALVATLNRDDGSERNSIFQVFFGAQSGSDTAIVWPAEADRLSLAVTVNCNGDASRAEFRYNPGFLDSSSIVRLGENFLVLLNSAVGNPSSNIFTLNMLGESERETVLVEWNRTAVDYPREVALHQLIEEQARRTPDSVAVVADSQQLTYRQLNERANQLAHRLRKLGVGPNVLVAVCAERSLEMVIALIASIKAGGAYVPLDPEYPPDRLLTMLQDSNPPVVLTQAHLLDRVPSFHAQTICLDKDLALLEHESKDNVPVEITGKNLAYCIYTSGSTGRPKGVPNVHEAVVNQLLWMRDEYKLTASDRILQKTPYSFDVSVWEFFVPLIIGATLVMARPGGHKDPAYLVKLIQEQEITTVHFVPSMLALFLETDGLEQCTSIRQFFASGEALPYDLQSRFFKRFHGKLQNLYGPTETAVHVTYWKCSCDYLQPIVPIGKPVANTQTYILDQHLQPVPIGVAGELHIGGIQLAAGYLNRPELTAEKFIPDPFGQMPGGRLYKTGDLARFLPDGNIEYLGRIDNQVKLRGFRIELGEIEAVLGECPGVSLAAAIVREDVPGDKRLVGYLVRAPQQGFSLENVRAYLKQKLPEFMMPSHLLILDKMPMTTSGKVDRRALPKPQNRREDTRETVFARNGLESAILPIFQKILRVQSAGVKDDFFELGGHSLLAARLLSEIKRVTGRSIPLSAMLQAATVERLAALIASEDGPSPDSFVTQIQRGEKDFVPMFAVVIPGVETIGYAALARHVGPQQPFYTVQGKQLPLGSPPFTRTELESVAKEYIAAIRSVQPEGPYCFIAMCDDVLICEEMILQLEREGQNVGFLAILDTWVLQNSMVRWKWKIDYYVKRLWQKGQLPPSDWFAEGRQILARKLGGKENPAQTCKRPTWGQAYWPGPGFQPTTFRAPVVLFKRPRQPFFYVVDRQLGWGQRSLGGVELHEIDLDHENLLREPHIKTIGRILAARLGGKSKRLT